MGNVSVLPGDLDHIFDLVGAKEMDVGGSELGWMPPGTSHSLWTMIRPDPVDSRDAAVSL